jgi:dTDP-4-dehydrorhamnose 3,5-epimerase
VACLRGALFDVVAEVDPGSPRFPSWIGFELRAGSGDAVYVPAGYAHGWQALDPGTELLYAVWGLWRPAAERGAKFDDSALSVQWPLPASLVSLRDRQWPDLPCPA